jgi:hypothetical protein
MRKRATDPDLLRTLYASGLDIAQVAAQMNASKATIAKRMREYGIAARPRQERLLGQRRAAPDLDVEAVCADYADGKTLTELSALYGVAEETLRRRLHSYAVPVRPRGQPLRKHLPNGGKTIDKHGYVLVLAPLDHPHPNSAGYIREHRLVMEQHMERYLNSEEVVHHRNGIKDDNRLENLRLYAAHSHHFSEHMDGNQYAVGQGNQGSRHFRTKPEMLTAVAQLAATLDRPIRRVDLKPPWPSYKALSRWFGHWSEAVETALENRDPIDPPSATPAASESDVDPSSGSYGRPLG